MQPPPTLKARFAAGESAAAVTSCSAKPAVGPLLIAGASVRAAVQSARRGCLQPVGADLFADLDLRRLAPVRRFGRYPDDLPELLHAQRPAAWMYTGALENFPDLVGRLSESCRLLGNSAAALRRVRDPWRLAAACREAGWRFPEIRLPADGPVRGSWLCKPFLSANGSGVRPWISSAASRIREGRGSGRETPLAGCYLQRLVPGVPYGAAFLAGGREAVLLGVCRQLCGERWLAAGGFRYCGSVGPLELSAALRGSLQQLGEALREAFELRGLFGVDLISGAEGHFVLEVNPRYTSSLELLDRILPRAAVRLHVEACMDGGLPADIPARYSTVFGKAILYASRDSRVTASFLRWAAARNQDRAWPVIADIPAPGWPLRPGMPITTLLAEGADVPDVLRRLRRQARCARRLLAQ